MLTRVFGIDHVPHLYGSEDLMSGAVPDSTTARRVGINDAEDRVHRRLVMGLVADCLHTFTSKKELIQAFIDVITGAYSSLSNNLYCAYLIALSFAAHQVICDTKQILHRDISTNNIMLYHPNPPSIFVPITQLRRGLLIDFDYATQFNSQGLSDTHRTVSHSSCRIGNK